MSLVLAAAVGAVIGLAAAVVLAAFGFRLYRRARRCS